MLGIVVSPAMATLGPQLRSAAPGPEPRRTPGAASAAWGSAGARWGSSRPAGPARDGWQARSPAGKDVTLPSRRGLPRSPSWTGGSGRPKGRDRSVAWGHERCQRSCARDPSVRTVGHEEDKTRVPRAEVPVGLVLCVLDLCFSLSAEISMTMCCGAFLKQ